MSKHEPPDPLIDEIRAIRAQISREHGDDIERLVQHYIEYQKKFADRLIPAPPLTPKKQDKSAA